METVKIVCKDNKRLGWKIINKCDMKPSDALYKEPVKKRTRKASK